MSGKSRPGDWFGAHNSARRIMGALKDAFREDLKKSVETIESELDVTVKSFAYPYGNTNERVARILKEQGLEAAPAIEGNTLAFPQLPANYFTVRVSGDRLRLNSSGTLDMSWGTSGTTGVFLDGRHVYFAILDKEGLQEVTVELEEEVQ